MDIADQVERLSSLLDTLLHAEELPNTYGVILNISQALRAIGAALARPDSWERQPLPVRQRLDEVLGQVEQNRPVFAIPELWLVDEVFKLAGNVRSRITPRPGPASRGRQPPE
jgi:hypothetical protein